ncbi:hypothetical protein [Candidatus Halobonum tyrrellensis]|nr:hypothetical protein [Candidatus Halobonum tyrrellensis]
MALEPAAATSARDPTTDRVARAFGPVAPFGFSDAFVFARA